MFASWISRLVLLLSICLTGPTRAEEVVPFGAGPLSTALLNRPEGPARAAIILFAGGNGDLRISPDGGIGNLAANQLVRTRKDYLRYNIATLTLDRNANVTAATQYMRKLARVVVFMGTSRGTLRATNALGSRPDGLVLTSGFWVSAGGGPSIQANVGSPGLLPPTLAIQNSNDQCPQTLPGLLDAFKAWGGTRIQSVILTSGGGGHPCEAYSPHGFYGADDQVVKAAANFVLSLGH